jgi:uncharacterized membrane protein AbrB (regulator of aidB expression)
VFTVPLAFRLLGYLPPGQALGPAAGVGGLDLAVLTLCGVLGFFGGQLLRLPAPGASVGCRFEGYPVARVLWMILVGLGLTVIMLGVTLLFGAGLQPVTGMPLPLLVLAFVPGGLAEMSLVALALTDDPAFVATNHIVRIGLVVVLASWSFRLYRRAVKLPP